jgi:uncharacterized membrane protein YuzA (DUF378 family)
MKILNFLAIVLLILGGLNWFLVGVFDLNLVSIIFGHKMLVIRLIYIVVGLAAFYSLLHFKKFL